MYHLICLQKWLNYFCFDFMKMAVYEVEHR